MNKITLYDSAWLSLWNQKTGASIVITSTEAEVLHREIKLELAQAGVKK